MNENAFIAALQDINNHPVRFGECTITFTFHDGRLQYYTLTTSERKNVADLNANFKKNGVCTEWKLKREREWER